MRETASYQYQFDLIFLSDCIIPPMSPEYEIKSEGIMEVCRTILVTTDGFVCIGKRPRGGFMGGYWCLVGGKAEGRELGAEADRETGEELGLPLSKISDEAHPVFAFSQDRQLGGTTYRNNYFIREIDDAAIPDILENFNCREFSEIAFVGPEDVRGIRFAFGNGKALRYFFKYVGN